MDAKTLAAKVSAKADKLVRIFVDEKLADEVTSFCFAEADEIAAAAKIHVSAVIARLKEEGMTYTGREVPKKTRGFKSNSHDRWSGPGSCATHGGSGWEQVNGFAGEEG